MGQRLTGPCITIFLILAMLSACPTFVRLTSASAPAGPAIDVHNHLPRGVTLEALIKLMNDAGARKTLLMPVFIDRDKPNGQGISDENLVVEFYKQQPDRIIPFLGMQRDWTETQGEAWENLLRFAESQLRTGFFRGIGEFILWHYAYSYPDGEQGDEVKIPADGPFVKKFLDLAAKYRVPVIIHYEIDEESLPSLKKMLTYGRKVTIILAHNGGRPDPITWKALLDDYPNLFYDLGGMTRLGHYGYASGEYVKNPIDDGTGHLRPAWKPLYEQYADRIVGIGTDFAHPEVWASNQKSGRYSTMIAVFRSLLSDLSTETVEKIWFRNAEKMFATNTSATNAATGATGTVKTGFTGAEAVHVVMVTALAPIVPLFTPEKRKVELPS